MTKQENRTSIFRLLAGVVIGAIFAAGLGFGLSAWLAKAGYALVLPTEKGLSGCWMQTGLNFLAIHHIRLAGTGSMDGQGSVYMSILWPITLWALIPAIALMCGGYVSKKIAGAKGFTSFWAGAGIAIPYAIFLLAIRHFVALPSTSIALPRLDLAGWNTDLGLLAVKIRPALGSTIFYGLLFGIVFGSIGAFGGPIGFVKGLFRRESFWPAGMRGALVSIFIGQLIFFLIFAAFGALQLRHPKTDAKLPTETAVTLLPAVAGLSDYLAHGVTLCFDAGSTAAADQGMSFRAGIINGVTSKDKKKPVKSWAYLAFLISGAALFIGGLTAAKSSQQNTNKPLLVASVAGSYALIMTAISPLYALIQRTDISTDIIKNSASIIVRPSAAQTFLFSLILALVFGSLGVGSRRK